MHFDLIWLAGLLASVGAGCIYLAWWLARNPEPDLPEPDLPEPDLPEPPNPLEPAGLEPDTWEEWWD